MTIKKKIAAVAAAAMMAMSITAISASAVNTDIYDCTLEQSNAEYTLNGKRAYGLLAVGMEGQRVFNSSITSNFFAETYYNGTPSYIRVTLDINKYPTGELLDEKIDVNTTSKVSPSRAIVESDENYGVVTLYASHEIRDSGKVWGEYTAIRNVQ